ncbi:MAG TPA: response regulator [Humidesulfovibrio sp.]|uniref:response regulator n=1 Tax=Humidesulfovibrio sp. TaxID=2910988 RepID=UPI002CB20DC4|nr:response regulator [Humidesulfovibrio sp.]HWR04202.1 response regulator [Humidesulfovibrio sp.]
MAMAGGAQSLGRVLVVDDEMHLRLFIKAVFDSAGYETATARDGEEGLRKLKEFRPRLVSLDLMMPNQGGIRFLTELRRDPELAQTRVLVVSAIEGETFRHSLALLSAGTAPGRAGSTPPGPDGYVEKPPTAETLLREARRILGAETPRTAGEGQSPNPEAQEA